MIEYILFGFFAYILIGGCVWLGTNDADNETTELSCFRIFMWPVLLILGTIYVIIKISVKAMSGLKVWNKKQYNSIHNL